MGMKVKWDTKKLSKKINMTLTRGFRKSDIGESIRDLLVLDIRENGINPKTGRGFKKLEKSTIRTRKYLAKHNTTHSDYSPSKSNLTLTGELLDSLKAITKTVKSGMSFEISAKGVHSPYKPSGKAIKNFKIITYLKRMGRSPLAFSKKMRKETLAVVRKEMRKSLKKL